MHEMHTHICFSTILKLSEATKGESKKQLSCASLLQGIRKQSTLLILGDPAKRKEKHQLQLNHETHEQVWLVAHEHRNGKDGYMNMNLGVYS